MVETQFDALGRAYRSSNNVVPQLAEYSYDELNRIGNVSEATERERSVDVQCGGSIMTIGAIAPSVKRSRRSLPTSI